MSDVVTLAKRPQEQPDPELESKEKRQKSLPAEKSSRGNGKANCVLRILCPSSKVENVLGEGGSTLASIKQESGAEMTFEELVPGCDERVVVIVGVCDGGMESAEHNAIEGADKVQVVSANEGNNNQLEDDKGDCSEKENGKGLENDQSKPLKASESAQKALLLLVDKMAEDEAEDGSSNEGNKKPSPFVVKLLVLSNQVGCLLGKGGSVIKQMSAESGAQIRILPRDKLPSCASGFDELIVVSGQFSAVKKALHLASQRLLENLLRERDPYPAKKLPGLLPLPENVRRADVRLPARGKHFGAEFRDLSDMHPDLGPPFTRVHDDVLPGRMALEVLTFRLLCMTEHVGFIIGKGGKVIRDLQFDTGTEIKIIEGLAETDDQVVLISAPAHPEDRVAPAQDALLRVQDRIFQCDSNADRPVVARILVSSNQIGCILGKGGTIINEMRKMTGAHIRILGKEQVPRCALENEEVIQVTGDYDAIREALFHITSRLRDHVFRERFSNSTLPLGPEMRDFAPPMISGRRDPAFHGIHSTLESSYRNFDGFDGPLDDEPHFRRDIHRPGMPPFFPDRAPWASKNLRDNVGAPSVGLSDNGLPQRRNGFDGGSQPAFITSTTIEVVVPQSLVPSLFGEDEFCVNKIREISGAKITITEPRAEASEATIVISGAPDETHAAQSLLQAFVMSEADPSLT